MTRGMSTRQFQRRRQVVAGTDSSNSTAAISRAVKFEATGTFGNLARLAVSRASTSKSGTLPIAARSASVNGRRHTDSCQSDALLSIS